ncbi:mitochondrial glyco protein [Dothidotthia symphoricarpi CBS 119687]|uniref:Mitochondrial glyco protein n=1 Tax=Dothidotthia symphoricarpi CBS 119687 TaxID=1392245 RepID=A0A6A6AHS4_9PLEO|nr:mitochondrial glyco protein [Dothidotthia symphoricarpi CBS 119687]KAF2129981.1 mitochondrial glyco protein [Dothidotthia symphoricarpi CBS 119687]
MLALRNLARTAPRSAARLSSKTVRPQPALLRQTAAFQPSWAQAVPRLTAAFHISAARKQESSGVSDELVAKLQSEISMEQDMKEDEDLSANIKEYLENSAFELEDKEGNQEVVLTRTFNDENIRITFTTADLNSNAQAEDLVEDSAMYDEDVDMETQSGGANTKGSVGKGRTQDGNVRVAPEEHVTPADREELDEEYDDESNAQGFPAHASIRIERPGKGALAIEATAQDGDFLIEDLYYFPSADLADPATAEKDWSRRTLYTGPPFNNLDEDLQILLEKYLEERGINTRLALFIPDYIDHKEQKEYIRWLNNVKTFIE